MDITTLHFLCGKMAAGKSTLARELAHEHQAVLLEEDHFLAALFPGEIHDRGESHAYGVAPDGQRFLIPQPESVNAGFGRGGPGGFATAVSFAVPAVTSDRRGSVASVSRSTAPITVVVNWPPR